MTTDATPSEVGDLRETKWWETKKVAEWKFEPALPVAEALIVQHGLLVVAVNLEKRPSDHKREGYGFVARSKWFGRREDIWADDLDALKKKVADQFRDIILAHSVIQWSDWLEVQIQGSTEEDNFAPDSAAAGKRRRVRRGGKNHASMRISIKFLKRAKFPDGRDMVLDNGDLEVFPKAKKAGTSMNERYSRGIYHQDEDSQYAYIPATGENVAAVRALMVKMDDLNDRLQGVLAQGALADTMKMLTSGGALRLEKK